MNLSGYGQIATKPDFGLEGANSSLAGIMSIRFDFIFSNYILVLSQTTKNTRAVQGAC